MPLYELKLKEDFDLKATLFSGQIFSFYEITPKQFIGQINGRPISITKLTMALLYEYDYNIDKQLTEFFDLDTTYYLLFKKWNSEQQLFTFVYNGIRLIKYDFIESLFSFICSSNNNIKRITKMINFMNKKGDFLKSICGVKIFSFPGLERLLEVKEFRDAKFGYRAEYIVNAAKFLLQNKFSSDGYKNDRRYLKGICGVGNKVADCVCLMGLGHRRVVPIDTHVFKSVKNVFLIDGGLNDKNYEKIQKEMHILFGEEAGIAQLYLFRKSINKK